MEDLLRLVVVCAAVGMSCAGMLGIGIRRVADPLDRVVLRAFMPGLAYVAVEWAIMGRGQASGPALALVASTTLLATTYVASGGAAIRRTEAAERAAIVIGHGAVALLLTAAIRANSTPSADLHPNALGVALAASVALGAVVTESLAEGATWPPGVIVAWPRERWTVLVVGFVGLVLLMLFWMPSVQAAPPVVLLAAWLWWRRRRLEALLAVRHAGWPLPVRSYVNGCVQAAVVWWLLLKPDALPW